MDMTKILPIKPQDEVNPEAPEDYRDDEGLLVCGVCGRHKQVHIYMPELGIDFIAPAVCNCIVKQDEERKRWKDYEDKVNMLNRIKASSLMSEKFVHATFENYIRRDENEKPYQIARNYVDKFQLMKENNQGLLIYGSVGTGKSFTAACIANALMEQGTTVVMTSFVKLLQEIQNSKEKEQEYMKLLEGASLLIIDDLGAERNTAYALEKVYNVIDTRVRVAKPMILTTNLTMAQMKNPESIEYQRIYDRIFEVCYPVLMSGSSLRTQEAKRRYESMSKLIGV